MQVLFFSFSRKPLGLVNMFTAFFVVLLGVMVSFGLFIMEILITKYGTGSCKSMMNAYNYRIDVKSDQNTI